jgi:hypothetical protein
LVDSMTVAGASVDSNPHTAPLEDAAEFRRSRVSGGS